MHRRTRIAFACVLAVVMLGGPVSAHDFTGSEERKNSKGQTTYTNDVRCASGSRADAGGVKAYGVQSGSGGGIGICNDGSGPVGSRVPVQGRAAAKGSTSGGTVYIDGDKNNSPEQMKGWARVDASSSGVKVRCGDEKGRRDATHPTSADGQEDCG